MKKTLSLFLIFFIVSSVSIAQEQPEPLTTKREILNGHNFQALGYFRTSFTSTNLQANIGIGTTPAIKIGGIVIDDQELLTFEGKVAFVNVQVNYQQRFTPWLALYFTTDVAARVGTDLSTILADGVNTLTGGKIGWLIRVKQTKKLNLSTNIHVANLTGNFININQYIDDVVNGNPNPTVTRKVPAMGLNVGVLGAYAFNPTYGVQFFSNVLYGESFQQDKDNFNISIGASGEMDLYPKYNTPLAIALGYVLTSDPEAIAQSNGDASSVFMGKIAYSASKEFDLGVQYSFFNINLNSVDQKTSVSKIQLMLKLFF